jgi:WD40 repeat protein
VITRDADTGQLMWARPAGSVRKLGWSADGRRLLVMTRSDIRALDSSGKTVSTIALMPDSPAIDASLSSDGQTLALVRGGVAEGVTVARLTSPRPALRSVLAGFGVRQVAWSPNGRWLLVSWPAADQWVFIKVGGAPRIAAVSRIARQFTTGSQGKGPPQLEGWCCTARGAAG